MLELENFSKNYGRHEVLNIAAHAFSSGLTYIKGKNGSGKSTLFRCIAGLSPFRGSILLNNRLNPQKHPAEYRKRINFAEAEPLFPSFLSGWDILEFVANAKGAPKNQLDDLIDSFHLSLFFENPAQTYSSGMSKKIALTMAFLGEPAFIILDEPFITLDGESCHRLEALMQAAMEAGTGILLSSHSDFDSSQKFNKMEILELANGNLHRIS